MKIAELREMTDVELGEELDRNRQELLNLRFQASTQQLENPRRIRQVRKDIARILTLLTQRGVEGI